jgi:hypothetical protein
VGGEEEANVLVAERTLNRQILDVVAASGALALSVWRLSDLCLTATCDIMGCYTILHYIMLSKKNPTRL